MKPRKYRIGHSQGQLKVTKELPFEKRHFVQNVWWYEVECTCGFSFDAAQSQLSHGKQMCDTCARARRSRQSNQAQSERKPIPKELDFARLRLITPHD